MAQVVVRGIEEEVKQALKRRAERNGHSMEEEVRQILRKAAAQPQKKPIGVGTLFAQRFSGAGLTKPIEEWRGFSAKPAPIDL
jgi:antitoxin FitA